MRYVVGLVLAFALAYAVLGLFALPAVVGVLLAVGFAARRGLSVRASVGLVAPIGAILVALGFVLAFLIVPVARMESSNQPLGEDAGNRVWELAPTVSPRP